MSDSLWIWFVTLTQTILQIGHIPRVGNVVTFFRTTTAVTTTSKTVGLCQWLSRNHYHTITFLRLCIGFMVSTIYLFSNWTSQMQTKFENERKLIEKHGQSWIEVDGQLHSFLLHDKTHPRTPFCWDKAGQLCVLLKTFETDWKRSTKTNISGKRIFLQAHPHTH